VSQDRSDGIAAEQDGRRSIPESIQSGSGVHLATVFSFLGVKKPERESGRSLLEHSVFKEWCLIKLAQRLIALPFTVSSALIFSLAKQV
jgi:hypothetical protein